MIVGMRVCYVLKGRLGFLCDTEWDGDSFCADPRYAYQYNEPTSGGRARERYACVRIKITTHNNSQHTPARVIPVMCSPHGVRKQKYKCKCNVCGATTNKLATPETAILRYHEIMLTDCITKEWELFPEE